MRVGAYIDGFNVYHGGRELAGAHPGWKWPRGGTASGSCDPSNNVVKWRILSVKIVRGSDNVVRWKFGPGNYHTNCGVDAVTYSRTPNLTVSQDHWVMFKWEFVEDDGTTFTLPVGRLISPR